MTMPSASDEATPVKSAAENTSVMPSASDEEHTAPGEAENRLYGEIPEDIASSPFSPLVRIGVNVQLGLDYCCGEHDFYVEMLQMFCSQAVDKRAELVSLYETADWNNYTVKVHALKSTAMTIGAERLADRAKLLEQAGKKGNIEYIRHDHPELLRLYDEVCETIAGL